MALESTVGKGENAGNLHFLLFPQIFYHMKEIMVILAMFYLSMKLTIKKKALENTVGKGENAGNQHFLLFPQCFLPYERDNGHFSNVLFVNKFYRKEESFGKHCGKRRKCWLPAFSPFPTVFSTI